MKLKTYKWHESFLITLKITVARFAAGLLPKNKQPIVLVGGNLGEKYEDNASVFHTYLVNNRPDVETYWMYDKNTDYVQKGNIRMPCRSAALKIIYCFSERTIHSTATLLFMTLHRILRMTSI